MGYMKKDIDAVYCVFPQQFSEYTTQQTIPRHCEERSDVAIRFSGTMFRNAVR